MKKGIVLLFIILSSVTYAKDYSEFCSTSSAQKSFSGSLMSFSGLNTLSRNIIESQISRAIKKETNSKFKIKINNFYGNNILGGEFKSLKATSKKYNDGTIFLSDLKVQTICKYNHIDLVDEQIKFVEPMVLKYNAKITQDDLNEIINSAPYQKMIEKMNEDETISSLIKIKKTDVTIKHNKLYFKYMIEPLSRFNLGIFKLNKFDIIFSADLKVNNGEVEICNFQLNSKNTRVFLPLINKLNPTTWKIDIDENNKAKLEVDFVEIKNDEILLEGYILIDKN